MFGFRFAIIVTIGLAGTVSAISPDPKSLAIPDNELSRARDLVQRLGSEQFTEREKAELELAQMGRLARPAIIEAANTDPNQEIRSRCNGLLPKATALEMRARLDVFMADTEGKYEHDLPGWNQFRATVGEEWRLFGQPIGSNQAVSKAARTVFAELIASHVNRELIMATGGSDSELGQLVAARRQELYNQKYPRAIVVNGMVVRPQPPREPSLEDLATLLFAESQVSPRSIPRTSSVINLITSSGFVRVARETDDKAKVYRAIAVAWLDTRTDPIDMYQSMSVATTLGLTEHGCRIGVRLLTSPGAQGAYKGMAATNLARYGNKDVIPQLEKALLDKTVAYTIRKSLGGRPVQLETHDVQVRDMALAVCVVQSGQKLEDYGFVDNLVRPNGAGAATYTYSRYYIPEEKRKAVYEKWNSWRQRNP